MKKRNYESPTTTKIYRKSEQQIRKQYERYKKLYQQYSKTMVAEYKMSDYNTFKDKLLYKQFSGKHDAVKSIVQDQYHSRSQTAHLKKKLREAQKLIRDNYNDYIDKAMELNDLALEQQIEKIYNMNMKKIDINSQEQYDEWWDLIYINDISKLLLEAGFVYSSD